MQVYHRYTFNVFMRCISLVFNNKMQLIIVDISWMKTNILFSPFVFFIEMVLRIILFGNSKSRLNTSQKMKY